MAEEEEKQPVPRGTRNRAPPCGSPALQAQEESWLTLGKVLRLGLSRRLRADDYTAVVQVRYFLGDNRT